jgi:hypothetical protein
MFKPSRNEKCRVSCEYHYNETVQIIRYDIQIHKKKESIPFIFNDESTGSSTVCLKSKCTDFPMDELEM